MKLYILFTGTYTNDPHDGREKSSDKKSSHKFILTYSFRSLGYWTTPMQDKLEKKRKKKKQNLSSHLWVNTKMALQATPETPQPQKLTDTGQYCGPLWLSNDKKHHPFQKVGNTTHHRAEQSKEELHRKKENISATINYNIHQHQNYPTNFNFLTQKEH